MSQDMFMTSQDIIVVDGISYGSKQHLTNDQITLYVTLLPVCLSHIEAIAISFMIADHT